jgi:hypothetical protein
VHQALHQLGLHLHLEAARLGVAVGRPLVEVQPQRAVGQRTSVTSSGSSPSGSRCLAFLVRGVEVGVLQELFLPEVGQHLLQFRIGAGQRGAGRFQLEQVLGQQLGEQRPQPHHQAAREPHAHLLAVGGVDAHQDAVLLGQVGDRHLVDLHGADSSQPCPAAGGLDSALKSRRQGAI